MSTTTPRFAALRPRGWTLGLCLSLLLTSPAVPQTNIGFRFPGFHALAAHARHMRHGSKHLRSGKHNRPAAQHQHHSATIKIVGTKLVDKGGSGRVIVPGVRHVFLRTSDDGPLNVHMLEVDLNRPNIRLELSNYGIQNHQATVARLASHHGVVAAINGSFFQFMPGSVATPVGIVMVNGQVLYDSRHRRTSFGINTSNEAVIGVPHITMDAVATDMNKTYHVHGVNTRRGYHQTILYTPHFSGRTRTNKYGRDIIVRNKEVVGYTMGNAVIPHDGYVLSISGMTSKVTELLPLHTHLEIATIPEEPRWDNLKFLITGGPQLVHNARVYNTYFQEHFRHQLMYPNARSAVGMTGDGKLLLVTVNPAYSGGGITYTNLAKLMLRMHAVEAMNLDGGSSATLYIGGKVVNRSDGWTRPVNNALLIYADPMISSR